MVPCVACSRGDRFGLDVVKALDKDEREEERVWVLLATKDQEALGYEEAEEVDSEGEDGDDCAGVDITFLTFPLPAFSFRLTSRWKVLMFVLDNMWSKESERFRGQFTAWDEA